VLSASGAKSRGDRQGGFGRGGGVAALPISLTEPVYTTFGWRENMSNTCTRRGICLVLSAPSGAGKSSLARALLAEEPQAELSVSVTTRLARPGEQDGTDYHFTSDAAFAEMAERGGLLEWARVFGRGYGTPRQPVEAALSAGRDVLFDIDWQGWRQIKLALPLDAVGVFILPPSIAALEARLVGRAGDDPAEIARRMAAARDEISHWTEFDHVLVNDGFDACLSELRAVLHAARSVTRRRTGLARLVATFGERATTTDRSL
jgi:guanylate kinase